MPLQLFYLYWIIDIWLLQLNVFRRLTPFIMAFISNCKAVTQLWDALWDGMACPSHLKEESLVHFPFKAWTFASLTITEKGWLLFSLFKLSFIARCSSDWKLAKLISLNAFESMIYKICSTSSYFPVFGVWGLLFDSFTKEVFNLRETLPVKQRPNSVTWQRVRPGETENLGLYTHWG